MGFRFRKSKNFGPFRINVSKSGIGWSVGTKGLRYTKRADGKRQTTLSVPGTGISYVDVHGNNKKKVNLHIQLQIIATYQITTIISHHSISKNGLCGLCYYSYPQ